MTKVYHRSNRQDWETPDLLYEKLHGEYNFACDLAASKSNTKCKKFIDEKQNSLITPWSKYLKKGEIGWCNPPYNLTEEFLYKAYAESLKGNRSLFLVASRPGSQYWFDNVHCAACNVIFITGRLKFKGAESGAPFESALIYYNYDALCSNNGTIYAAIKYDPKTRGF